MRALKAFAVAFFLCSLIVFCVDAYVDSRQMAMPWIAAESDEVTVSVNDDRSVWQEGITAGVGGESSLTDRVRLTHVGKMDAEGRLRATFTVTDDLGRTASLARTVLFSDYTPPTFTLLRAPRIATGATLVLSDLIMVCDPLDGDITHRLQVVSSDLDTANPGDYEIELTVENSYGVSADYTLMITVI